MNRKTMIARRRKDRAKRMMLLNRFVFTTMKEIGELVAKRIAASLLYGTSTREPVGIIGSGQK